MVGSALTQLFHTDPPRRYLSTCTQNQVSQIGLLTLTCTHVQRGAASGSDDDIEMLTAFGTKARQADLDLTEAAGGVGNACRQWGT